MFYTAVNCPRRDLKEVATVFISIFFFIVCFVALRASVNELERKLVFQNKSLDFVLNSRNVELYH